MLSDQVVDATVTGVVNNEGTVYLGMDGGQLLALANVRQVTTPKVKETTDDTTGDEGNKDEENKDEGSGSGEGSGKSSGQTPGNGETDQAKAA